MEETDLLKNLDYPIKVKDELTTKFHLNHNELQTGLTETELEQSIKLEEKEKEKKLIISTDPTIETNTQLTQSSLTPEPNNNTANKQENNIITNNQNIHHQLKLIQVEFGFQVQTYHFQLKEFFQQFLLKCFLHYIQVLQDSMFSYKHFSLFVNIKANNCNFVK